VEDNWPRRLLSAREYMAKFHPDQLSFLSGIEDLVIELKDKPIIPVSAMDCKTKSLLHLAPV